MKRILIIICLFLLSCKIVFASNIAEELTQLNNLFKEGAITKEEFSKAKSILLKTNNATQSAEKEKKTKKIVKEKKKKEIKKQKIVKKNINEDLTKSYMHIDEIGELGNFEIITDVPEGMFKTKGKSFSQRAKNASQNMYLVFVQQKNLMEKNPENLMKAMGHFEFFYMEQLRKKQKNLATFKEKWPDIPHYIKKDIKSLYSLNQARKSMRESMGLTLEDDVQDALKRYMLMHNFLSQAKKETIKLSSKEKKLRKNSKKLNTSLSNIEKNIKLRKEQRITDKEFKKNLSKDIKKSKQALKLLSKDPDNMDFYKNIDKVFVNIVENNSDLDLSLDSLKFVNGIIKDVEKDIIPKKYIQNMDGISVEEMAESDQKILASVSMSMKMQKKEKKDLLQNSILNLSNNGINVDEYVDQIEKNGFDLKSVTMTFDDFDNMKRWASKDWAKSWKGELPAEIKDIDGNIIEFTKENIQDLKAQLAINTFNDMIDIDQNQLQSSLNDSIKEIAKEIQSSGGFNIEDYLNQDFSITLNNYSQLVGNAVGIDINDFKDLTRYANELYGTDMKAEDYANHWESAQFMDSTSNWGDVTIGVDLIDQVGSFDAASIAQSLGADLQTVADSIAQAATVGVSTDLEAAAQGLGYGSFADAVAAYNKQYGTSYTVDSAKEALGQ
tara:strand:- start:185 stop:2185 length:2001 start_codon:yes stop_codon:yes gene_type:complete